MELQSILTENSKRIVSISQHIDTEFGIPHSTSRFLFKIRDIDNCWLPKTLLENPLILSLRNSGSISGFLRNNSSLKNCSDVIKKIEEVRIKHDFLFWAGLLVKNNPNLSDSLGENFPDYSQLNLIMAFEKLMVEKKPVFLCVLKSHNDKISGCIRLFVIWWQTVHKPGVSSLIVSPNSEAASLSLYRYKELLSFTVTGTQNSNPKLFRRIASSKFFINFLPSNCNLKFIKASNPDACRAGSYSVLHFSDMHLWKHTDDNDSHKVINAALAAVPTSSDSLVIMDSLPCKEKSLFAQYFKSSFDKDSLFSSLFIPWYWNSDDFSQYSAEEIAEFASLLIQCRYKPKVTGYPSISGSYIWSLWESGASLQSLKWYLSKLQFLKSDTLKKLFPSFEYEAFYSKRSKIFSYSQIKKLSQNISTPTHRLQEFEDTNLKLWSEPYKDPYVRNHNQYLAVLSCRHFINNEYSSSIIIFDRMSMSNNESRIEVVVSWSKTTSLDRILENLMIILRNYNNPILVIENTVDYEMKKLFGISEYQFEFAFSDFNKRYDNILNLNNSKYPQISSFPLNYGYCIDSIEYRKIKSMFRNTILNSQYIEHDKDFTQKLISNLPEDTSNMFKEFIYPEISARAIGLYLIFANLLPTTYQSLKTSQVFVAR